MATLRNLPEEVTIEILSRLPVKSLIRFKSVRKSWYALINDPNFVRKHFSNSPHHNHVLLKSFVTNNNGEMGNLLSILKFPFSVDRSEYVTDVHFSCDEDFMYFDICGDSHGLICLSSDKDIFLCNPSTREIRKLPLILHPTEMAIGSVGFGYDAKSKDFKGTYYWWTKNGERQYKMIEFDTSEEVFGRMSLPGEVKEQRLRCKRLGVLNGSLVLFSYSMGEKELILITDLIFAFFLEWSIVFWMLSFEMYNEGTYYWWAENEEGQAEI